MPNPPPIQPTKKYVLVLRDKPEVQKGGIFIPDAHMEISRTGIVQAVGKEVKELQPKDRVLFIWSAGFDIRSTDVEYNTLLLMKEDDILAVLNTDLPVDLANPSNQL